MHKFQIGSGTALIEVPGANGIPWYPGSGSSELYRPHGIATDLNGRLYIGKSDADMPTNTVRRLNCDGVIEPASSYVLNVDPKYMYNMFSIGNTIYTSRVAGPAAYNSCTGASLGNMCLANPDGSPAPYNGDDWWGLSYNKTTQMVYATRRFDNNRGFYAFTRAQLEAGIAGGACVTPLVTVGSTSAINIGDRFIPRDMDQVLGITGDNAGNIYLTCMDINSNGFVLKYDASGGFLAKSAPNPALFKTHGIVWSETSNKIYVANNTDNPQVDCVSAFDAGTLAYAGAAVPNPGTGGTAAKALAIVKECCPVNLPATFSKNVCGAVGTKFYLNQEAFSSCDGIVCGSSWTPVGTLQGMTFDPCDNSVTITGEGCGTFTLNIGAIASTGCGAQTATFTICNRCNNCTLGINTSNLPDGQAGTAYSQTIATTGGTAPLTFAVSAGALPAGLTLDPATGVISGTPTAAETGTFTIKVTDSQACEATVNLAITTSAAPVCSMTATATPGACVPATNQYSVTGTITLINNSAGGTATISDGTVSTTISIAPNATTADYTLTGLTSDAASHTVTISLTGCGQATPTYTAPASCTIPCDLTITTTALPDGQVGTAYSQTIATTGGTAPLTFVLTGLLPAGLNFDAATGVISGTPTTAETLPFSISVTDSRGCSTKVPLSITVANAPVCSMTATATPGACVPATNQYSVTGTITLTNNSAGGTVTITDGTVSTTLSIAPNATTADYTLTGLTSDAASHTVTISLTGCGQATPTYTAPASCAVAPCILAITTTGLSNGQVGTAYSQTIATTGGTAPLTFAVSAGALPAGLTLDPATGVISGTPTAAETATFTIKVTDSKACEATVNLTITTSAAPVCSMTATATPSACVPATNQYSVTGTITLTNNSAGGTATITDGTVSTTISIAPNVTTADYTLTGLTSDAASHTVTISLTGCGQATANYTAPASCAVAPCNLAITTSVLPNATVGISYNGTVSATGGTAPYIYSLIGTLPTGLTLNSSTGTISGKATIEEVANFTIKVTDSKSCSATAPFTIATSICTLTATASVSACDPLTNTYTLTLNMAGVNVLKPYTVFIKTKTINIASSVTNTGPTIVKLGPLPLDGLPDTVKLNSLACGTLLVPYTAPTSCATPCSLQFNIRATDPTCSVAGQLELTATNGDKYGISKGATYTGPAYAAATAVGTLPILIKGNISHAADSIWTIRVFNKDTTCFKDTTVTVKALVKDATVSVANGFPACRLNGTAYTIKFTQSPAGAVVTAKNAATGAAIAVTGDSIANIPPTVAQVRLIVTNGVCRDSLDVTAPTCNKPEGSIGDLIWKDVNDNGLQDLPTEKGVAGVKVNLYAAAAGTKTGSVLQTKTTDAAGLYLFSGLVAGDYIVEIDKTSLKDTCTITTKQNTGSDDTKDSDFSPTTGLSQVITLNPVFNPTTPTELLATNNLTVDAGLVVPCIKSKVTLTGSPVCSTDLLTYSLTFSVANKVGTVKVNTGTLTGTNPYTVTGIPSGTAVTITDSLSAVCKFDTLITAPNCNVQVDLALKKAINTKIAQIGDLLTYTVKVYNQSNTNATGVEVTDSIAATVQFQTGSFIASRGSAAISGNVIKWTIGNIAANGDTVTLTYKVKATQEGVHFNTAEISKTNEKDIDSTPGNGKEGEDDIDSQCFTVPIKLCPGEKVQASVPAYLTNVQWFKNGTATAVASGNTVLLTETGSYRFTATNQTCPIDGCCPVIIEPGTNCCPEDLCIPFTVKKRRK